VAGIDAKFMMLSLVFSARKRVQTASLRMCVWYFAYHFSGEAIDIKKKYRLTKWNIIYRPKDQGGLGIEVLELKNKCLLSKWLYKL
jgi:hypothetical protein